MGKITDERTFYLKIKDEKIKWDRNITPEDDTEPLPNFIYEIEEGKIIKYGISMKLMWDEKQKKNYISLIRYLID